MTTASKVRIRTGDPTVVMVPSANGFGAELIVGFGQCAGYALRSRAVRRRAIGQRLTQSASI
jgi:hypothetical protein